MTSRHKRPEAPAGEGRSAARWQALQKKDGDAELPLRQARREGRREIAPGARSSLSPPRKTAGEPGTHIPPLPPAQPRRSCGGARSARHPAFGGRAGKSAGRKPGGATVRPRVRVCGMAHLVQPDLGARNRRPAKPTRLSQRAMFRAFLFFCGRTPRWRLRGEWGVWVCGVARCGGAQGGGSAVVGVWPKAHPAISRGRCALHSVVSLSTSM